MVTKRSRKVAIPGSNQREWRRNRRKEGIAGCLHHVKSKTEIFGDQQSSQEVDQTSAHWLASKFQAEVFGNMPTNEAQVKTKILVTVFGQG
jgi:hypothetical protein